MTCSVDQRTRAFPPPAEDRPHDVAQRTRVVGALAQLDVDEHPEERASPIRATPGVGVVEPAIAVARQALVHVTHPFAPHLRFIEHAGARTQHRLEVGRQTFAHPAMATPQIWKRGVRHLVHHHPVPLELAVRDPLTDHHAHPTSAKVLTKPDPADRAGDHTDAKGTHREATAVVVQHPRGAPDPKNEGPRP